MTAHSASCGDCRFWLDGGVPRTQTVRYPDGDKTYPAPGPFHGKCRAHPPIIVAHVSGSISGLHYYGKGASVGGGGSYDTKISTEYPTTNHSDWCGEHQRAGVADAVE